MSSPSPLALTGQVAIVTGGTRGLGRAIARRLAAAGCKVVICGRHPPEVADNTGLEFIAVDVRNPVQVNAFVADVAARHGRIDILVNNAGGSPSAPAATASPGFSEAILKLNLLGPYFLAQAVYPHMVATGAGSIVNIASVSGTRPSPGTAVYGAAKAGLLNLTQSLAQEWGGAGIRVNAVIVGLAETENTTATYGSAASQAAVAASLPLQRMANGDDVANAVLYLCSPLAAYVSGARLHVDGGGERPYFLDLVEKGGNA